MIAYRRVSRISANGIKYAVFLILAISLALSAKSGPGYDLRTAFTGLLDNREYFNSVQAPGTFFAGRIEGDAGFFLDSSHMVRAGASYQHEFGAPHTVKGLNMIAYYRYSGDWFKFYLGSFPRRNLVSYPRVLLSDSVSYYRPNLEGTLFSVFGRHFVENIWVDWTSRQDDTTRETFLYGAYGRAAIGDFFLDHHSLMYHRAGPAIRLPGDHIRDNGGLSVVIGWHHGELWILDTMEVSAGAVVSFDRIRGETGWNKPAGGVVTVHLASHGFGLTGHAYCGNSHTLLWGDSFYSAKSYGRIDVSYSPRIKTKSVMANFTLGMHFVDNVVDFSQFFTLTISLRKPLGTADNADKRFTES
jgi:hypothetical protein